MAKPSQSSKPPTTPPLPMQEELKKIIQYIAQVYKLLKESDEKLKALEKRISDLEKSLSTVVTKSVAQLKADLMKSMEKDVQTVLEKNVTPLKTDLMKSLSEQIQTIINKEILPQLTAIAAKPAPAPKATPAPEPKPTPTPPPKEPEPTPATVKPVEVQTPPSPPARAPSDIPDARISTVTDELENIVKELKGRQKVQREFLRPLLEQARDVAMNNLSSRAVAARTFKEIINIVKNSPFDVPHDVIETIITKLEELSLHIRT